MPESASASAAAAALGGPTQQSSIPLGAFVYLRNARYPGPDHASRFNPRYWVARVIAVGASARVRLQWYVEECNGNNLFVQTPRTFVENASTLRRLDGMEFDASRGLWSCVPSPLMPGDELVGLPLMLIANELVATTNVELSMDVVRLIVL